MEDNGYALEVLENKLFALNIDLKSYKEWYDGMNNPKAKYEDSVDVISFKANKISVENAINKLKSYQSAPVEQNKTVWVCNECDSAEYTGSVSEHDLKQLQCSNCGAEEFHKELEK